MAAPIAIVGSPASRLYVSFEDGGEEAPVNSVAPVASGTSVVGSTLSCSTGTWSNTPTGYAYQWLRDGSNISGATSSTYQLQSGDEGADVSCRVTASNAAGSTSADSNEIGPITAPSEGALAHGDTFVITGSGFGTNALTYKTIGGADGKIESTSSGTPSNGDGWTFNSGSGINAVVSTAQARSGNKSLFCNLDAGSQFNCAIRFDWGSGIGQNTDIYVTWWVRRSYTLDGGSNGQWKMFRLSYENDIQDGPNEIVMFNWLTTGHQFFVRTNTGTNGAESWDFPFPTAQNRWYRMELRVNTGTINGSDGFYSLTRHDPTGGNAVVTDSTTGTSYTTSYQNLYRWFLWQNYIGNGMDTQPTYLDDLYVQVGTIARLEICDNATYNSRTFCEIQFPTSWSDTSITAKFNKGGFASGATPYVYVITSSGTAIAAGQVEVE